MNPISFFCLGVPKAQPRAKAFSRGGRAGVYDPGTANDWKTVVRNAALKVWDQKTIDQPVSVTLHFIIPRPQSHYRTNGLLKPNADRWVTKKPDLDNLEKAVLDALTDIGLWRDDSLVVYVTKSKTYAASPESQGCQISISGV